MAEASLRYYACGQTSHQMRALIRGAPRERRPFPAGVFLFTHADGRTVLFDTGYAPATWRTGIRGLLYHALLPVRISAEQSIAAQLISDGMDVASIDYVVLSHLHPDHIGGVRYFPTATFVLSTPMLDTLARSQLQEGFIPQLLPVWFPHAKRIIVDPGSQGFDLLGDGSYLLLDLPGHARGHMGALVLGRALLAGDASWGEDLMDAVLRMKKLPRAVIHNWDQYCASVDQLRWWQSSGVEVFFSHDRTARKELLE